MSDKLISSYRVQLNSEFTFSNLEKQLPYLKKLGIKTLYLSPVMQAAEGSTHFYDVYDPGKISDVLGGEKGLFSLVKTARKLGFRIMVDFVPNHMTLLNAYLLDILKKGKRSKYRNYFDIFWDHPYSKGKIMLPLTDFYLTKKESERIILNEDGGSVNVNGAVLPLRDDSDGKETFEILSRQYFKLVPWFITGSTINYRRFFAVNSLIAVNIDDPKVFRIHHGKIFQLMDAGLVDALRIDHIDGLMDPVAYTKRLKKLYPDLSVFLEKIMCFGEELPSELSFEGLTGYDSMFMISSLFHDQNNVEKMKRFFCEFTGIHVNERYVMDLKLETIRRLFSGDLDNITRLFLKAWKNDDLIREIPPGRISYSIALLAASMDRYRTYYDSPGSDCTNLLRAADVSSAYDKNCSLELRSVMERICRGFSDKGLKRRVSLRFQTFSGPVMAKSVEDCLFYRDVSLLSLNEVGFYSGGYLPSVDDFNKFFLSMSENHEQNMLALSTHDTKFGEDLRARFIAISYFPDEFFRIVNEHKDLKGVSRKDIYFISQIVSATLPSSKEKGFKRRIESYLLKALRESGLNTSWENENHEYEKSCISFLDSMLDYPSDDLVEFSKKVQFYGSLVSISQSALKFLLPGTSDTYQGSEVYNLSFVDPDNRRKISFNQLKELLDEVTITDHGYEYPLTDQRLKLWLTWKLLHIRSDYLSCDGIKYEPLGITGKDSEYIVGFMLSTQHGNLCIVATRKHQNLWTNQGKKRKMDFRVSKIEKHRGKRMDLLRGIEIDVDRNMDEILGNFPLAVVLLS